MVNAKGQKNKHWFTKHYTKKIEQHEVGCPRKVNSSCSTSEKGKLKYGDFIFGDKA